MIIGTTKELKNHEYRVGITPDNVKSFVKDGHTVLVESNAGKAAGFANAMYEEAGAQIVANPKEIFEKAYSFLISYGYESQYAEKVKHCISTQRL